jgi:hypothetical protein
MNCVQKGIAVAQSASVPEDQHANQEPDCNDGKSPASLAQE